MGRAARVNTRGGSFRQGFGLCENECELSEASSDTSERGAVGNQQNLKMTGQRRDLASIKSLHRHQDNPRPGTARVGVKSQERKHRKSRELLELVEDSHHGNTISRKHDSNNDNSNRTTPKTNPTPSPRPLPHTSHSMHPLEFTLRHHRHRSRLLREILRLHQLPRRSRNSHVECLAAVAA